VSAPPGQPAGPHEQRPVLPACVRHPDRPTGLSCSRCGRPACPECLRSASVGQHCVDCLAEGRRSVRTPVTIAGARPRDRAVVMPILVAVNVLVYAVTVIQAGSLTSNTTGALFEEWVLWPIGARNGGWWEFITAGFLHFGPIHILMNMVALWIIGRDFERVMGPLRFTVIYFVALFGGSVSVFLFSNPDTPEAGASGAVYGLMGGLLVLVYRLKLNPGQVIGMIVINLAISVAIPGISLLGHIGGLISGIVLTAAMVWGPAARRLVWQVGAVVVVLVLLVGLVLVREQSIPRTECHLSPPVGCQPQ
jgi:membrane associated rhomboid family serine protease